MSKKAHNTVSAPKATARLIQHVQGFHTIVGASAHCHSLAPSAAAPIREFEQQRTAGRAMSWLARSDVMRGMELLMMCRSPTVYCLIWADYLTERTPQVQT
jgi:hypothetical protein